MACGRAEPTRRLQEGARILQHSRGPKLETHAELGGCWTGLYFTMEQKPCVLSFALASLRTSLDFFHGEMDKDGTLRRWTEMGH